MEKRAVYDEELNLDVSERSTRVTSMRWHRSEDYVNPYAQDYDDDSDDELDEYFDALNNNKREVLEPFQFKKKTSWFSRK